MCVHEDHVAGVGVAVGEDVGALDGLWVEAEDVVDAEDGNGCGGGARHVGLEAIELDVFTLRGVVLGDHGRDSGVGLAARAVEEDCQQDLLAAGFAVLRHDGRGGVVAVMSIAGQE